MRPCPTLVPQRLRLPVVVVGYSRPGSRVCSCLIVSRLARIAVIFIVIFIVIVILILIHRLRIFIFFIFFSAAVVL